MTLPEPPGGPRDRDGGDGADGGEAPRIAASGGDGTWPAPEGVEADKWTAALKACGDLTPAPPGPPPAA